MYGLSSPRQDERMDKMWASRDGLVLVYKWVKQSQISFKEFVELVNQYTKE